MNQRIKELWENSDEIQIRWPTTGSPINAHPELLEKFAELIVQECCDVLQNEDIRHSGYGYNQGFLHKKIKQHFGVEE